MSEATSALLLYARSIRMPRPIRRAPSYMTAEQKHEHYSRESWRLLGFVLAFFGLVIAVLVTRPGYLDFLVDGVM